MSFRRLICHPSCAKPAIEIDASALVLPDGTASFRYRVRGDVRRISLPPDDNVQLRADELWRHTCFEAFVRPKTSERYVELNFASSGACAAYSFDGHRVGMKPAPEIDARTIRSHVDRDSLTLEALVRMGAPHLDATLGLAAVIEDVDGNLSYWALAHPRAQPDFHDSAAWTSEFQRVGAEEPA